MKGHSQPISLTGIRFYVYIKQVKHSLKMIFKPNRSHLSVLFDCSRYNSCPECQQIQTNPLFQDQDVLALLIRLHVPKIYIATDLRIISDRH